MSAPTVTLRRDPGPVEGSAYDVLVDGEKVGHVHQGAVTHDRKPRGSRIATTRTQSLRWFAIPGRGHGWTDRRWQAVAIVLAEHFGGFPSDHDGAAYTARTERAGR